MVVARCANVVNVEISEVQTSRPRPPEMSSGSGSTPVTSSSVQTSASLTVT